MFIGGLVNRKKSKEDETNIIDEEIVEVIPESFCGQIKNGEDLPIEVLDLIKNFMDDYFLSIYTLELQDISKYFSSASSFDVTNSAIKLLVESRKLYDFDFTMSKAYYDLNITEVNNINGKYYVDFLEDDYYSFKFLDGITTELFDIENSMIIEKVNNEYKISSYDKVQDFFVIFTDNNDDISTIYDFYFKRLSSVIEDEKYKKQEVINNPYVSNKSCDISYNRDKAVSYADSYCHNRNSEFYDYSDEGGNCQNLASQVLICGGMIMDYSGEYEWYYDDYSDYTSSWVHVKYFNEYCNCNNGSGLVTDVDTNIYYVEPGDIIQVGVTSVGHTTIVSKVVDGHILLNSNSIDMRNFPLEAYTYPVRKLIKILGSNY